MRCDANISIMPVGSKEYGTRAEIKNLNSFKALERAIEYEVQRQKEILEDGGHVVQETRTWDDAQGMTFSMRSKEEAHDYRYFPEPDLAPIIIDDAWIEKAKSELPELPDAKKDRLMKEKASMNTMLNSLYRTRNLPLTLMKPLNQRKTPRVSPTGCSVTYRLILMPIA